MGNSNTKKSKMLGMPYGTAMHQLRRAILFSLIQETKKDVCFVCGETIKSALECSIEHKQPWESSNPHLFWDLSNIAFSHLKCNRPHKLGSPPLKSPVNGEYTCARCETTQPIANFVKAPKNSSGLGICKACKKVENKKRKR